MTLPTPDYVLLPGDHIRVIPKDKAKNPIPKIITQVLNPYRPGQMICAVQEVKRNG